MPFKHARVVHKKRKVAKLVIEKLEKEEVSHKLQHFGPTVEITLDESDIELKIESKVERQKVEVAVTKPRKGRRGSQNNQECTEYQSNPTAYSKPLGAALHLLYNLDLITKHGNT